MWYRWIRWIQLVNKKKKSNKQTNKKDVESELSFQCDWEFTFVTGTRRGSIFADYDYRHYDNYRVEKSWSDSIRLICFLSEKNRVYAIKYKGI